MSAILVHNPSHLFPPHFCRVRRTVLTEQTKTQYVLLTFYFPSINPHSVSFPQTQISTQLLLLLASGYSYLDSKLPPVTCLWGTTAGLKTLKYLQIFRFAGFALSLFRQQNYFSLSNSSSSGCSNAVLLLFAKEEQKKAHWWPNQYFCHARRPCSRCRRCRPPNATRQRSEPRFHDSVQWFHTGVNSPFHQSCQHGCNSSLTPAYRAWHACTHNELKAVAMFPTTWNLCWER